MENLYITFEVAICEQQYYGGRRKNVQCEIAIPREALESLDPGNIFFACLKAALVEYDKEESEEDEI